MSFELPDGCYIQRGRTKTIPDTGNVTITLEIKGEFNALETAVQDLVYGDEIIEGAYYSDCVLKHTAGTRGVLSINCITESPTNNPDNPAIPTADTWELQSVRNDMSIMAYCGESPGANPQRTWIESWQKEPSATLADAYSFKQSNGEIFEIPEGATRELIDKIRKGADAVMRFYPVLTRTRFYKTVPSACLENLGLIDTPPVPATFTSTAKTKQKGPNGLKAAVDKHQWLKCKDDVRQQSDGFTRVESWMGLPIGNVTSPWDEDFYGANRWGVPYFK